MQTDIDVGNYHVTNTGTRVRGRYHRAVFGEVGIMQVIDNYGLNEAEKTFLQQEAEEMSFDFIRYADEITVTISAHKPCKGETWVPEFDVFIEGTSEVDERGNGYFGYISTRELLADKMSKEY